ncbi:MAG: hypothetical protein AAGA75_00445 [Cyanobacteria bacterium P01_E01_bin.6]
MTIQELLQAAQELSLADQISLASQLMQSAAQKIQIMPSETIPPDPIDDPLVGFFSSSPDLATRSEEILTQELNSSSGFSWKG